jgi:hypothetical protein
MFAVCELCGSAKSGESSAFLAACKHSLAWQHAWLAASACPQQGARLLRPARDGFATTGGFSWASMTVVNAPSQWVQGPGSRTWVRLSALARPGRAGP